MHNTKSDKSTSVLIVGAGPSGLMMAHELSRFGIDYLLIEKKTHKNNYSKAIGVQIRTLEMLKSFDLYDNLLAKSQSINGIKIFIDRNKYHIDLFDHNLSNLKPLIVDQPHTEEVLAHAIDHQQEYILYGNELINLTKNNNHFHATIKDHIGTITNITATYVIGADGHNSFIRKIMDSNFIGFTYKDAFILADVICETDIDHARMHMFINNDIFFAMIPMHGLKHYRLISLIKKDDISSEEDKFIKLTHLLPFSVKISNFLWASRFLISCRSAQYYQKDGMFLIGDAAHVHSPIGGQGMNTGLQDAHNLAWKIAMDLKGMAKPILIKSYQVERQPVGEFLIKNTDRLFKFIISDSFLVKFMLSILIKLLYRIKSVQYRFFAIMSQVNIRYKHGVICSHDDHESFLNIKIGQRIININLISNHLIKTDIHHLVNGLYFSLFLFFPDNVKKLYVKTAFDMIKKLSINFGDTIKYFLLFANDFDAEKLCEDHEYYVVVSKQIIINFPFFILARPDAHVFCYGKLSDDIDLMSMLHKFLSSKESLCL